MYLLVQPDKQGNACRVAPCTGRCPFATAAAAVASAISSYSSSSMQQCLALKVVLYVHRSFEALIKALDHDPCVTQSHLKTHHTCTACTHKDEGGA